MDFRVVLAVCLSAAALSAPAASADPPAPHLTPAARCAVDGWRAAVAEAREKEAQSPPSTPLQEIASRARIDAAARNALMPILTGNMKTGDRVAARAVISPELTAIDAANTAFLKDHLPETGWFTPQEHGAIAAATAWIIVQHSPDHGLQKEALSRIEPLVATGEIKPAHYAMLYDRVAVAEGRLQRYGTQATCNPGEVVQLHPLEDPAQVDVRRAAIGLGPAKEDADAMGVGARRC